VICIVIQLSPPAAFLAKLSVGQSALLEQCHYWPSFTAKFPSSRKCRHFRAGRLRGQTQMAEGVTRRVETGLTDSIQGQARLPTHPTASPSILNPLSRLETKLNKNTRADRADRPVRSCAVAPSVDKPIYNANQAAVSRKRA
jgi:hypothetical protein